MAESHLESVALNDLNDRIECQAQQRNVGEEKKEVTWQKWDLPLEKII